jgi:hypothetical protein
MRRTYASRTQKAGSQAIGLKVKHLIDSAEFPNTPAGRKKALGMSYGMQRAGRLTSSGDYIPVKKR